MARVFVVQEMPGRNILPARKYGELLALLPSNSQVLLSPGPTVERMRRALKDFCDDDFLLLSGDPVAIGIAMMVAGDRNLGRVKVLKWDREEGVYFPIEIDLHKKGELV